MQRQLEWQSSIFEINQLPEQHKRAIYGTLLPQWLCCQYGIDPYNWTTKGETVISLRCPEGSRTAELAVYACADDRDPVLYINVVDTLNHQLLVVWAAINDIAAQRFDTDMDVSGIRSAVPGTPRNLDAERSAMAAGLAPGQVRQGLRVLKETLPVFERFVANMRHSMFFVEPLAYHNAILFERYGFAYVRGLHDMQRIDRDFHPGGELHARLAPDNPFRQPEAWRTVRGRSWAIHDGILGHPYTDILMYKRLGTHAGLCTFPDATW